MPPGSKEIAEFGDQLRPFQFQGEEPLVFNKETGDQGLATYSGGHAGFLGWLMAVDARVQSKSGVGLLDLPDTMLRDQYDAGCHPDLAADDALEEAHDEEGLDAD